MAVSITGTSKTFVGTGVSSVYAPEFYANSSEQVQVRVDAVPKTLGDDYVLGGLGAATGVNVTANFPNGSSVVVERVTPRTQLVDTQNNETILEDVLDAAFDKLTMIAQEQDATLAATAGLVNYRATRGEGIADFAVGEYFSSAETGELRVYRRIATAPYYLDQGDAVAPATKAYLNTVLDPIRDALPTYSLDAYGADPTGATFSDNAFTAVLAAIGVSGGTVIGRGVILAGAGTYKFSAQLVASLSLAARNSFILRGQGPNVTHFLWPNASAGIAITVKGQENAVQISDLSLLTSRVGGGTALSITNTGAFGGGDGNCSNIERVYFAGDDKTTLHDSALHYWTNCVITTCHSNINYLSCSFEGNTPTGNGNGVTFQGNAGTTTHAVVCNFSMCQFNNLTKGFIYGTWAQGVSFSQCNFTSGDYGIFEPDGMTNLAQLAVVACQFAINKDHILLKNMPGVNLIGNTHYLHFTNQSAIAILGGHHFVIQGNTITGPPAVLAVTNGIYVYSNDSENASVISGNVFYHLAKGVWLDTLSSAWNVQGNSYKGNTANVLNTGTGNSVGVATQ